MQTPIWKKGAVIIAGMALLLGWTARADDSFAPCWRGNSGTTFENWTFTASNNPAAPDFFSNPNGIPQATMTVGAFGTGWQNSVNLGGGKTGVWDLGQSGQVSLSISNYGGSSATWEYVQVQVTYFDDGGFGYVAPTISVPGATFVSSQTTNNQTGSLGTWKTLQSVWLIQPSPVSETVVISGSATKGLLVDQVVVDTRSPVGGDSVPAFRPCWRGLTGSTYEQWSFGVSNNPASIPAELVTNIYGVPVANFVPGAFSSGYIEEDPFLGCVQGIWDLGDNGMMTFNIPNNPSASGGSYKYVQVQVTQYRDSSIYNTNANVTISGGVKVNQQQQTILTNNIGAHWVVDKTIWRLTPSPAFENIVVTAGTNGALIDQVTVDTLSLDFTCPTDIVANADLGQCSKSNVTWTLSSVDGCVVTNVVSSPTNGSTFAVGTNLVTSIIMDSLGGIKTCTFNVIVHDTQPPTVFCPANITVAKDPSLCGAVVNFTPTAVDNCTVASITSTPPSGSVFPLGLTTVTCVAHDASGNDSSPCTFTVRVVDFSGDVSAYRPCWRGLTGSTFQQWAFSVSNNPASLPAELVTNIYGVPQGSVAPGPFSSGYIDADPFLGCVQGIWDLGQSGMMTFNISNNPTASGGSYKYVQVQVTQYRDSSIYNTNANVTITGGVEVSEQQQVILTNGIGAHWVVDNTVWRLTPSPAFETVVLTAGTNGALIDQVTIDTLSLDFTCPTDIVASADLGQCSKSNVTWTLPSVDGCVVTNVVSSPTNGSTFAVGTNLVTSIIMDSLGGMKTCNFNVIVTDDQPPVALCKNITVFLDAFGLATITAADVDNGSSDNCGIATRTVFPDSFTCANKGSNSVLLAIVDVHGHSSTCNATVIVSDNLPPTVTVPTNIVVSTDPGLCSAVVNYNVSSNDNCGVSSAVQTTGQASGTAFPHGTTTNTFVVTDTSGNSATNSFTVTVNDHELPVIICPSNLVVAVSAGQCGTNVNFTVNATDNCGVTNVTTVPASGSVFPVGTTHVTSVAVDSSGNMATCGFDVTVVLGTTNTVVVNFPIPDGTPLGIVSTMNVNTPIGSITNLKVTLNITNGYNGDLYAYLVHQSGFAILLNRVGKTAGNPFGYGDSGFNVTLDDGAANGDVHIYRVTLFGNALVPLAGPLTGTWAPDGRNVNPLLVTDVDPRTATLGSFQGMDPNGQWTLFVADMSAGDVSTLVSWSLDIQGGYAAPAISNQPADLTVECGHAASFSVTATGTAPLGYQWYFGTNGIANATNATLTLPSVSFGSSGGYSVVITNGYCMNVGSVTSRVAVLNVVDTNPPAISAITATQNGTNAVNCAITVVQGQVAFSVVAANVSGNPSVTMVNGTNADAATFVNQSPAGTFNYVWNVTNTTVNGTWIVTVTAADLCTSTNASFTLCVNKTQISGQVQLQSFTGTGTVPPHTRAVTFVASTNWVVGLVTNTITLWTNTVTLTNVSGDTFNYLLTGVPTNANGLSAKTAWNLRSKVTVTLDTNSQATAVNFTGAKLLPGGDFTADNIVNLTDYIILRNNYLLAAPVADINGDGIANLTDYIIMRNNWFSLGDPP